MTQAPGPDARLNQHIENLEELIHQLGGEGQDPATLSAASGRRLRQAAARLVRLADATAQASEGSPSLDHSTKRLVGRSQAMNHLRSQIGRVAPRESNVLILGASGTGKELVARAVHSGGPRREGQFIAVDCGALNDTLLESELFGHRKGAFTGAQSDRAGLLEEADGGTLFLDELANASPSFQTRLLRVLQEGEVRRVGENRTRAVSLRIIAATSGDLPGLVRNGSFRGDLYYRINVLALALPPLRDRCADIPDLLQHFLRDLEICHGLPELSFSAAAMEVLLRYRWPGNIRELRNVVERAALMTTVNEIRPDGLPPELLDDLLVRPETGDTPLAKNGEQRMIEQALLEANGQRTAAARIIGWPRSKLYRRLHRYAIPTGFGRCPPPAGNNS